MNNILTFDVEEWYHANYSNQEIVHASQQTRLTQDVQRILDLCSKYRARATFFILGEVAQAKPDIVSMIYKQGHEVASHGYSHQLVYRLSPEAFEEDVKKSVTVLEQITQKKVIGYRAPSWSFSDNTGWVYPILAKLGLSYSASVFPIKTFLYGMPSAPRFPYAVNCGNGKSILEIPSSTVRIGNKNFPFAGGAYLRILPRSFVRQAINHCNKEGQRAIVYLHPREIDPHEALLKLPLKEHLIHTWGLRRTESKLTYLLKQFSFNSIEGEFFKT